MPFLLVQLCAQTAKVLGCGGLGVAFAGFAFAEAFVVVEAFTVLFLPALDVFILRHGGDLDGFGIFGGCWTGAEEEMQFILQRNLMKIMCQEIFQPCVIDARLPSPQGLRKHKSSRLWHRIVSSLDLLYYKSAAWKTCTLLKPMIKQQSPTAFSNPPVHLPKTSGWYSAPRTLRMCAARPGIPSNSLQLR